MKTVLVTGAGGPAGRALIAQLAGRHVDGEEIVLIGADMTRVTDDRLNMSALVPAASDPEYTPVMRHLIGACRVDLVLPTVSEELLTMAAVGELLVGGASGHLLEGVSGPVRGQPLSLSTVVIAPPAGVAIAADKLHTMWLLDAAGVAVPRHASAAAFTSAQEALDALGGPIVVKPRVSRGGRGVHVVEQAADLDWASLPAGHIVQAFAPGVEYCPQVHRSWETGTTTVVVLEKTVLREGRVGNADAVRRVPIAEAADVARVATAAVEALGLTGPIDLDIRRDAAGVPVVLEVNARFGANSVEAPEILGLVLEDAFGLGAGNRERGWTSG